MDSSFDSTVGVRGAPADLALWQTTPALLHAGFGCDPDVAVAALVAGPDGRFYALDAHGGGETALALVSRGARTVVDVPLLDREGAACVVGLKVAALRALDREAYLKFVGLRRASRAARAETWAALRPGLPVAQRMFWDRHADVLTRGLFVNEADVAQGRLLRDLLRTHLSKPAYRTLLHADRAHRVAAFEHFIAGRKFWENALRMCAVRGQFRICAEGEASPLTCTEPMTALRRLVEAGPAGCPVWVRAFANDAGVEGALPWHLSPAGYAALRENLDALHVELDPVAPLTAGGERFDAFDLSRARGAMAAEPYAHMLGAVVGHARSGARLLVTAAETAGLNLDETLVRDARLETYVQRSDRAPGGAARQVLRRI